jgi:hypothetical protein
MKKQLTFLVLLALLGAFVFSLVGCGDEPNPCKGLKPVTADFEIYEAQQLIYPDGYKPIDSDTVVTDWVEFNALEQNASYAWTLGKETITTKSFKRFGFPRGQNIQVSLKVTKAPNKTCFPTDNGVDSVKRTFYITPRYLCDSKVTGTYEGYDEGDQKNIRTIIVDACAKYPPGHPAQDVTELRIVNLKPSCNNFAFGLTFITYKQAMFGFTTECFNPTGLIKLSGLKNEKLLIEYTVLKDPNGSYTDPANKISKKFLGSRK